MSSTKKYLAQTNPELAQNLSDTDGTAFKIANEAYKNKDFKKVEKYCLKAVNNKNATAMYVLALLYETEYKDFKKAEKYYLMAVDNKYVTAMYNLALLYEDEYKDFEKAEKYYLMAVDNKNVFAMYNLAFLYETEYKDFKKAKKYHLMAIRNDFKDHHMGFLLQARLTNDDKKNSILRFFKKYHKKTDHISLLALSLVLIHAEKYKESIEYFNLFLDLTKNTDDFQNHITSFFLLLISRKQYNLAFALFQDGKYHLKEKIKPVYFALMTLMKEEYPKEYKRMGAEISDTVDEVLQRIEMHP